MGITYIFHRFKIPLYFQNCQRTASKAFGAFEKKTFMNHFLYHHFLQTDVFLRKSGGAEEARTPDILLAKQALFQLSYSPTISY